MPGPQSIFPQYALMKYNTALCFILVGAALFITQFQIERYNTIIFQALSLVTFLIGALSVSEELFHFNTGIDQLFMADKVSIAQKYPFPGRMAADTSACFVFFGLAFLGFSAKNSFICTLSQYFLHVVTAISAMSIIGYLYGLSLFYNSFFASSMAAHTAILLFFLSIIASLLHPSIGVTGLFKGNLVGNIMARRLFMLIVFMVIIFGSLKMQSQRYQLFSWDTGISLLAICFLWMGLAIIWHTANWLNKIDKKRYEAEEEVKVMIEELEKRVEERTGELISLLEKFRESEEKYRSLVEHASDAIYILDIEGNFTDANESMCKMTGFTKEELFQLNIVELADPEQLKTDQITPGSIDPDQSVIREQRLVRKDGQIFDVEINVKMIADERVLVIARDITERKRDEEILKRSEANLKIIMDTTDTAYALLDKKLNILDFNQMTVKFLKTQFNKTPFKGDSLSYYFPKEKFPQFIKQIDKVLKGRNISYELNYSQPDGSVFWYYTRLFPITNDQNKIVGLMMAFSDITERKNAEESLKTAYGRIRDQIQSIKDIAWKQSHLIRSPVANLKGLVALLKQDPMNSELINFISTELERLDNVIIDMAGDASNHDL